jgi:xylulokinase
MSHFLGLDIGTSSIKGVVLDTGSGTLISSAKVETPIQYESPTKAIHDPDALLGAVYACIRQATAGVKVDGLGISCFAEAGIPLDLNRQPLYPIIAWFDQRSQPQVQKVLDCISERELEMITGQKASYSFGLFKYLWLKEHHPDIMAKMQFWLSVPDYLLYQMTGEIFTDYTQASRTMLFDQKLENWSEKILGIAQLTSSMLPKPVPSGTVIGGLRPDAADQTGLPKGLPCCVGGHDHLCGMFASGGISQESLIDSSGSSQAIMALTDTYLPGENLFDQGFVHYHHVVPKQFIIKGGLKAVGKAFQWLTQLFHIEQVPSLASQLEARFSQGHKSPVLLPFFQGTGTPNRMPFAQGALMNLDLSTGPEDILLSFYEGLSFWLKENLDSLSGLTQRDFSSVIAIGGTNQNPDLLQIKANVLNMPLVQPEIPEPSALGAALLAAVGCGVYQDHHEAQQSLSYTERTFTHDRRWAADYEQMYHDLYLPAKAAAITLQKADQNTNQR